MGTAAGVLAALALAFGAVRCARPDDHERFTRRLGKPLFAATVIASALGGSLALWWELPWWTVPPTLVPLLAYVTWQLHRNRRADAEAG
ncbi:hypothetical protein [Streptomyces tritici]|uniref:hypothetical protein n=1 Tax=Streptomyces tritici TaxID=2054410 RepID=UPI003AF133C9